MELLVLRVLDWRLRSISPFCYLSFFALKIDPTATYTGFLASRAKEIILSTMQGCFFLYWKNFLINCLLFWLLHIFIFMYECVMYACMCMRKHTSIHINLDMMKELNLFIYFCLFYLQRPASLSTFPHALLLQPCSVQQTISRNSQRSTLNTPNHGAMDFTR